MPHTYALENLYNDHDPDLVEGLIAPVLAWISPTNTPAAPPVSGPLDLEHCGIIPSSHA